MIPLKKRIKHFLKDIFKSSFVVNLIGDFLYLYTYLVGKTGSYDTTELQNTTPIILENNGAIFVSWHGRALMLPYFWHHPCPAKALASPHQDGRIISRLLNRYKIKTIDGSTDRNATHAVLDITQSLNSGNAVCLISDGPRGPRMKLNKSVIYFAQKTGKPIIGITYSSTSAKILHKSWDALLLPKLFAKGYVGITAPLFVSPNASAEEMEVLRQSFEDELNNLTFLLDKKCNLKKIEIGITKQKKRLKTQKE